jgi:cellulose 1,4-beta-cellobiosidase
VAQVKIRGKRYDIWFASPPQIRVNYIAYVPAVPQTNVGAFDLREFIRDATRRGYLDPRWYQLSVEAGFEIWKGGAGLKTNSFSVSVR